MTNRFDEFSKSLATNSVSRRESLQFLGATIAGAFLGLKSAFAGGRDPCRDFCNLCPKWQRNQCLAACQACLQASGRICGTCSGFDCCHGSESCCGTTCHVLASEFEHCGACSNKCDAPRAFEEGACIDGRCTYWCVAGAVICNGRCSVLNSDPLNCGTCGNVCPGASPACSQGVCIDCGPGRTWCQLQCVNLLTDNFNCGKCNNQCPGGTACESGVCVGTGGGDGF